MESGNPPKRSHFPTHSYYTSLYMQYSFIRDKGEMHFTPSVQTIYAARQAIKEYWQEDIDGFNQVMEDSLKEMGVRLPLEK